jgi:nitroreductase
MKQKYIESGYYWSLSIDTQQRVSILQKIISLNDMQFILETAHLSPSSFGFEPWHFIIVQDKNYENY